MSAAVLHGLPVWPDQLRRVQVIRDRDGGGRSRRHVTVRGLPLHRDDVVTNDGLAVTSLARTVVDLACQLPMRQSVAVGDAALRWVAENERSRDLSAELASTLKRAARRPGVPTARRAIAFLDPRSESAAESVSRVLMHEYGVPTPELQYEIFDAVGLLIARSDFAWPELKTLGEFDGGIKYSGAFGKTAEQVIIEEKRRENVLRGYGWQVVRWTWPDLSRPADLVRLLERTFERGRAA